MLSATIVPSSSLWSAQQSVEGVTSWNGRASLTNMITIKIDVFVSSSSHAVGFHGICYALYFVSFAHVTPTSTEQQRNEAFNPKRKSGSPYSPSVHHVFQPMGGVRPKPMEEKVLNCNQMKPLKEPKTVRTMHRGS